ncbi:GcrA family cell cycle regulator [Amaricoccus solimangrovi]|uniref:GcrA cell cycle regulator n=1 Tax=Amaricoccus solimangrovi TaxID=2589815 RepID=A0A501WVA6_9RHOB|nr:GcrA family cell cycle regulator [Amaricoccus solimangrovi]TPE52054.1 GcrA cell cycle regulator [Amaricoccus solimangrovi]
MSWTDERVEMLKVMWSEGKSASQIAKELGGVTRNAVIGKVHRLGLSNRGPGSEHPDEDTAAAEAAAPMEQAAPPAEEEQEVPEPSRPAAPPAAAAPRPPVKEAAAPVPTQRPKPVMGQPLPPQPAQNEISPEALANLAEVAKKARKLSLMQLTERTCKWPVGDPATDDFWFCGLPSQPGKPYCETHVAVAFQPMSARRDRRAGGR